MTKDGDMRVERRPFPMTILISTQDVGAFQGGWDTLLKQLFSDPLRLRWSSSLAPPHHTCFSRIPGHTLGKAQPEFQKQPPTAVKRLPRGRLVPGPQ